MPWARASALHRHLECPAASWLPRDERGSWRPGYLVSLSGFKPPAGVDSAEDSVVAEWGTQMHLAKEHHPDACDPWLSWVHPHRERLWPKGMGHHERSVSYDCATGRVLLADEGVDKDLWKSQQGLSCVTGTCDWDAALPSGEPWVDDLKTGWSVPSLNTPQMLFYAMCFSKVYKWTTCRISVTHWRRGWEIPDRRWLQVGPVTLESFEEDVVKAYERARQDKTPRPGPHCKYCPSAMICPAVKGVEE